MSHCLAHGGGITDYSSLPMRDSSKFALIFPISDNIACFWPSGRIIKFVRDSFSAIIFRFLLLTILPRIVDKSPCVLFIYLFISEELLFVDEEVRLREIGRAQDWGGYVRGRTSNAKL